MLVTVLPVPALFCRRMHDLDRKGWWAWVPIYNSIMFVEDGLPEENRFGMPTEIEIN